MIGRDIVAMTPFHLSLTKGAYHPIVTSSFIYRTGRYWRQHYGDPNEGQ